MRVILSITALFLYLSVPALAQVETPISFTSEDDNKVVQETDSGKYYAATGNDGKTVFINEELKYRLYDKDNRLVAEGTVSNDGDKYLREGHWTEYYPSGKIKNSGQYHRNNPVGTWEKYYANGNLMSVCSYAMVEGTTAFYCMTGTYEEFF